MLDDVENNQTAAWFRGKPAFVLAVQKQPGTNAVEVSDRVRALLPVFRKELPAGGRTSTFTATAPSRSAPRSTT